MAKKKVTTTRDVKTAQAKAAAAASPSDAGGQTVRNERRAVAQPVAAPASDQTVRNEARAPFRRPQSLNFAGIGRNDICPCGSGKRFKNCHGH